MAKQPKANETVLQDMPFPVRGVNDGVSLNDMPQGFTPEGENVRAYEALTGRGRGGSRAGIDKFIHDQHSGTHEIQMLATIVTVDGSMLGWAFNGRNQGFPGVYGGIGFSEPLSVGFFGYPGMGGGGYPPNPNIASRLLTMGARDPLAGTIVMSDDRKRTVEWPAGEDPIIVRITNQDGRSGDYLGFENLFLHSAETGEAITSGIAQFDTVDPPSGIHGLAEFEVVRLIPQTIEFYGMNHSVGGRPFESRFNIRIRFTPYSLRETAAHAGGPIPSGGSVPKNTPVTITGTLKNPDGTPAVGRTVRLNTLIPGQVGDGMTAVTNGAGVVTFIVSRTTAGAATYLLTEVSETVSGIPPVTVNYTEAGVAKFRQIAIGVGSLPANDASATFDIDVLAGSLIVVTAHRQAGILESDASGVGVTDSLGNTYSLAKSDSGEWGGAGEKAAAWMFYAANVTGGPCTVTIAGTDPDGLVLEVAVAEYTNIATSSALVGAVSAAVISGFPTTGDVAINAAGDLIVGMAAVARSMTLTAAGFMDREPAGGSMEIADKENATATAAVTWTITAFPPGLWIAIGACFKKL